jgi:predicted secreted hydrolase
MTSTSTAATAVTEQSKSLKPADIEVQAMNHGIVEQGPMSPLSWRIAPRPQLNSRKNTDLDDYFVRSRSIWSLHACD